LLRYYIVPEIGGGIPLNETTPDSLRPKYFGDMTGISWSSMRFGGQPIRLVGSDLSVFDQTFVTSHTDVLALPADLNEIVLPPIASSLQTKLEDMNIPAHWVSAGMTYRQVLRKICHIFQFMQRLKGLGLGRLLGDTINLDTKFVGLPAMSKSKLRDAADDLKWDKAGITNTATLRQILKSMADQWEGPVYCGGAEI
jgi:hypothetical protein